jgi:xanthine dehydrogenase accessory factor
MLDLFDDILRRADAGEPLAVCTVVRTRGSTPQKAGAVMLVRRDGRTLGTIGGGCVEADVRTRALVELAADPRTAPGAAASLHRFTLDHDPAWDDGLVCGGVMDVAVEVVHSPAAAATYRAARDQLAAGREAAVRIVAAASPDGEPLAFERTIEPAPALVIAGAGHVGVELAAAAARLGFGVTVVDDRADLASADRFPGATRVVGPIDSELARLPVTPHTYVVIVTRGHRHDGRALAAVVGSPARYVGLIGSKRKVLTIFAELRRAGVPAEQLARVHAPVGLDVGAVTPAEIAVSIAAELIAVRRGAAGRGARPMRLTVSTARSSRGADAVTRPGPPPR